MSTKTERMANRVEKAFLIIRGHWDTFENCTFDDFGFPPYFITQLRNQGIPNFDTLTKCNAEDLLSHRLRLSQLKRIRRGAVGLYERTFFPGGQMDLVLDRLRQINKDILQASGLDDLELRTKNVLKRESIFTFYDISLRNAAQLEKIKGLGKKSMIDLEESLVLFLEKYYKEDEGAPRQSLVKASKPIGSVFDDVPDEALLKDIILPPELNVVAIALKDLGIVNYLDLKKSGFEVVRSHNQIGPKRIRLLKQAVIAFLEPYKTTGIEKTKQTNSNSEYSLFVATVRKALKSDNADSAYQSGYELIRIKLFECIMKYAETAVTKRTFGIFAARHSENKKTLEEIGGELGVTRERIRQIDNECVRRVVAHFSNEGCSVTDSNVREFYTSLLFVGEIRLIALLRFLQTYDDVDWAIVSTVLRENQIRMGEKKALASSSNPSVVGLPKSIASRLTYCRLYQASEFIEEMLPINDIEEMKNCVVKHVPGKHVERLARPMVSIPAIQAICYGRTDIDGVRFDGMVTIQGRFVFLVRYYDDVQKMVSGDEPIQIERCRGLARARHIAFATVIKGGQVGIKRLLKRQENIRPAVERRFLNVIGTLTESDHEVSTIAKKINASEDTVIALGLKHGCSFTRYPFSIKL